MYFQVYRDIAGEWRWRGKAHNHVTIADSGEGYTTKTGCLRVARARCCFEALVAASRLGYRTRAIVIGTEGTGVSVERMAARARAGNGPAIGPEETADRWKEARRNLVRTAPLLDVVDLIDNTGPEPRAVARIENGRVAQPANEPPEWAARLIERITAAQTAAAAADGADACARREAP